jgi:hypothetical protein
MKQPTKFQTRFMLIASFFGFLAIIISYLIKFRVIPKTNIWYFRLPKLLILSGLIMYGLYLVFGSELKWDESSFKKPYLVDKFGSEGRLIIHIFGFFLLIVAVFLSYFIGLNWDKM